MLPDGVKNIAISPEVETVLISSFLTVIPNGLATTTSKKTMPPSEPPLLLKKVVVNCDWDATCPADTNVPHEAADNMLTSKLVGEKDDGIRRQIRGAERARIGTA